MDNLPPFLNNSGISHLYQPDQNNSPNFEQAATSDQPFRDFSHLIPTQPTQGQENIEMEEQNLNYTRGSKRKNSELDDDLEQQSDLKKIKLFSQNDTPEQTVDRVISVADQQLFVEEFVNRIEDGLSQGIPFFVDMIKSCPEYLNYVIVIPTFQSKMEHLYGYSIHGQNVFQQLVTGRYWDLIEAFLQAKIPLNLNPTLISFPEQLFRFSPLCEAIFDDKWDIAELMLEPPYEPYIGPANTFYDIKKELLPVHSAIENEKWDFVRKLLSHYPQALNTSAIEKYDFDLEDGTGKENLLELMEHYPIHSSQLSTLLYYCLDWACSWPEGAAKILTLFPHLHLGIEIENFIVNISDNQEYTKDIIQTIDKFNLGGAFTQKQLAEISRVLFTQSELWSTEIAAGKEIFYHAIFHKFPLHESYSSTKIKEAYIYHANNNKTKEESKFKDWLDVNTFFWKLNGENQVVLKPIVQQIVKTQEAITKAYDSLYFARAAHADSPFINIPDELFSKIAKDVLRATPELATIPTDELIEALGKMHRYGKGRQFSSVQRYPYITLDKKTYMDAKNGHPHASYQLGMAHLSSQNATPVQLKQAVEALKIAADQGHIEAQSQLAWMLLNGIGVESNKDMAIQWYKIAANQGSVPAYDMLQYLVQATQLEG